MRPGSKLTLVGILVCPQASGGGAEASGGGEVEWLGKQTEPESVEGLLRGGLWRGRWSRAVREGVEFPVRDAGGSSEGG